MHKKILGFVLTMVLVPNIYACKNENSLQVIEYDSNQESIDALTKKNKSSKNNWFDSLSPELQAYYADAKGKTGAELFRAMHDIISKDNKMDSYSATRAFMFSSLDNVYSTKNKSQSGVIDAYSQIFIPGEGGLVNGYKERGDENRDSYPDDLINAEHTWPQSFYGSSLPMVSDLHALHTVLRMPNVMRSDFPFGEVKSEITYSTYCGSKLSVLDFQGNPVTYKKYRAILDESAKNPKTPPKNNDNPDLEPPPPPSTYRGVFEPCNSQKGNTARSMLYFYLRYHDMYIRQGSYNADTFWKSKVKMFIRWAEVVDKPDSREKSRNEAIYQKQGNRNPFVDIPNFASLIGEQPFINN